MTDKDGRNRRYNACVCQDCWKIALRANSDRHNDDGSDDIFFCRCKAEWVCEDVPSHMLRKYSDETLALVEAARVCRLEADNERLRDACEHYIKAVADDNDQECGNAYWMMKEALGHENKD